MKIIASLFFLITAISTQANVLLSFELEMNDNDGSINFNERIEADFSKKKTLQIPDSNHFIELELKDKTPKGVEDGLLQVLIDLKVYKSKKGIKKLISSPQIMTILGRRGHPRNLIRRWCVFKVQIQCK